ncbi:MAG: FecR family protein [Tannerella sp.]|jgi:ferric-dicitrate binding protein FerR (iron transport regulator)|nr:FecR family protein [Tannerella sp.]
MTFREKENIITDMAWKHLHDRLAREGLLPGAPDGARRRAVPFAWRTAAAAAAIILACVFSALYIAGRIHAPEKKLLVLRNEANAQTLAAMLHDGSVVYLSEQTSLTYPDRFSGDRREVTLNGEAFFEVNGDSDCPFFIDTDLATVEVTGTAFNVRSGDHAPFLLSVRDGEVRVSLKNSRRHAVSAKAGETVSLDAGQLQLGKTDRYRSGGNFKRIHFRDERLEHIVAIINTRSDSIRIQIDPELGGRLLTMPVNLDGSFPEIAEIICLVLNLQHTRKDNIIHISKKQ